jgi:hypothetical protein
VVTRIRIAGGVSRQASSICKTVDEGIDRMTRLKIRWQQYTVATLCAFGVVVGTAVPAQAVKWHQRPGWCGTFFTYNCTLEYTGGWPDGQVRGQGQGGVFAVKLHTKTSVSGSWRVAKATYPLQGGPTTTPATKVGKTNWYRVCITPVQGGTEWCGAPTTSVTEDTTR